MYSTFISAQNLLIRLLRRDERGATAVEYGLIVAMIAAVIALGLKLLGHTLSTWFTTMGGDF
jgi:pilus assembly protein Flp/PilA